jgi:hypothetical protein
MSDINNRRLKIGNIGEWGTRAGIIKKGGMLGGYLDVSSINQYGKYNWKS